MDAPQTVLHDLIYSLYAKVITMDAASFEDMIALANYLQVAFILEDALSSLD